jgi:hypothetical protein
MTDTARSAEDTESELRSGPTSKKRVSATAPAGSGRARAKKAASVARTAHESAASPRKRSRGSAHAALASSPPQPAKTQFGTLLVGAGIGAAVTLSVVALGSKRGRGSTFALALAKSASYAIARTTERGSLLNLVAQVVGSAIA